jgi:hypothetical protein
MMVIIVFMDNSTYDLTDDIHGAEPIFKLLSLLRLLKKFAHKTWQAFYTYDVQITVELLCLTGVQIVSNWCADFV